jgi:hypothetical protein
MVSEKMQVVVGCPKVTRLSSNRKSLVSSRISLKTSGSPTQTVEVFEASLYILHQRVWTKVKAARSGSSPKDGSWI